MTAHISRINTEDTDAVFNLNNVIFNDQIVYPKSFIQRLCTERKGFLIKFDQEPVGYILCENCYNNITKMVVNTIFSIGVLEKYRKRGFGKVLLKALIDLFPKTDIYLNVRVTNLAAQSLYRSEGFVTIGTLPKYYKLESGLEDAYSMVRFYEVAELFLNLQASDEVKK